MPRLYSAERVTGGIQSAGEEGLLHRWRKAFPCLAKWGKWPCFYLHWELHAKPGKWGKTCPTVSKAPAGKSWLKLAFSEETGATCPIPSPSGTVRKWCPRGDSNPHAFRHRLLRPACLPIPPPGHLRNRRRDAPGAREASQELRPPPPGRISLAGAGRLEMQAACPHLASGPAGWGHPARIRPGKTFADDVAFSAPDRSSAFAPLLRCAPPPCPRHQSVWLFAKTFRARKLPDPSRSRRRAGSSGRG